MRRLSFRSPLWPVLASYLLGAFFGFRWQGWWAAACGLVLGGVLGYWASMWPDRPER